MSWYDEDDDLEIEGMKSCQKGDDGLKVMVLS